MSVGPPDTAWKCEDFRDYPWLSVTGCTRGRIDTSRYECLCSSNNNDDINNNNIMSALLSEITVLTQQSDLRAYMNNVLHLTMHQFHVCFTAITYLQCFKLIERSVHSFIQVYLSSLMTTIFRKSPYNCSVWSSHFRVKILRNLKGKRPKKCKWESLNRPLKTVSI